MSDPLVSEGEAFVYSASGLSPHQQRLQRLFEIAPGAASWSLLLGMVILSWFSPESAIICIIALDLLWIFFLAYAAALMLASALRLRIERETDWMARLRALDANATGSETELPEAGPLQIFRRLSHRINRAHLRSLRRGEVQVPASSSIYHVVIFTISDEGRRKIETAVECLLAQDIPPDRIMVILAPHEGAHRSVKQVAWELHREHFEHFAGFYVAPHPSADGGEGPIKGAAVNFAARMAATALEKSGIGPQNVVVSCLEASSYPSPNYLACLTWKFLACPDRERACFQPVPAYHRNVWKAPASATLLHLGSSFLHRIEATDPDGLVAFASYSMSLKTLTGAGYWPDEERLSGDSAFFWKAFLRFDGRFRTVLTTANLSQDIVRADTFKNTLRNVYQRKKNDASAMRNFPIIVRGFLQAGEIPFLTKLRHSLKMLLKQVGAATWIFLLLVVGWLPGLAARYRAPESSLSYFAPRLHAVVCLFALLALAATAFLSALQLPRREPGSSKRELLSHVWAWIVLPPLAIFLTAYPYIVVQTKLMLGKDRE